MTESARPSALILHAGAIGDVVLGTLVPTEIKRARPELEVIYWTHESLIDLLKLCPAIDSFVVWNKRKPLLEQSGIIRGANAQVFVDLSSSLRTRIISLFAGRKTLRYVKQPAAQRPIVHAANNFRDTVTSLIGAPAADFPTLLVSQEEKDAVKKQFHLQDGAVALVPGVGSLRPHRAWPPERWSQAACLLASQGKQVILIGGPDDQAVGKQVEESAATVVNLVGKLSLRQTAAVLSICAAAVSGDTGPLHIAVAVGTPTLGLLGPTFPERSGPFGYVDQSLYAGHQCRCHSLKGCIETGGNGPGNCMSSIGVNQVLERLTSFCLANSRQ